MAPVDRVIFHIGIHKTGTTAIQGSLVRSSDALLARGVLYPQTGRRGAGQAQLAAEVRDGTAPWDAPIHRSLLNEVRRSAAPVLILSAEDFSSHPRAARWARTLCSQLQPQQVRVVAYLRPQWDYLESSYAGRVKTGKTWAPFDRYFENALASGRPDYLSRLAPWRDAFGAVEVRPYAPDLLLHADVVADFWEAVGLGAPIERAEDLANRRTGARATEMLRQIRMVLAHQGLDRLIPVRQVLGRGRRRIEAELPNDPAFAPLTRELVLEAAERFARANAELVREYLGGRHATLLAPPASLNRTSSTWNLRDASDEELSVLAGAFEQVMGEVSAGGREGRRRGRRSVARRKAAPRTPSAEMRAGSGDAPETAPRPPARIWRRVLPYRRRRPSGRGSESPDRLLAAP